MFEPAQPPIKLIDGELNVELNL